MFGEQYTLSTFSISVASSLLLSQRLALTHSYYQTKRAYGVLNLSAEVRSHATTNVCKPESGTEGFRWA